MKKNWNGTLCAGALLLGLSSVAQATLIDNLDGTITDDSTGLMWMQDANLGASNTFGLTYDTDLGDYSGDTYGSSYTEVIRSNGNMSWGGALHWIDAMNAANYKGYNNWRLPTVTDRGNDGCNFGFLGTDCGHNVDTATGELAYLYHDILGNKSSRTPSRDVNRTDCFGIFPNVDCLQSTGADGVNFLNIQSDEYYYGTEDVDVYPSNVWIFYTDKGYQGNTMKHVELSVWAVRSGDVAGVPEPSTLLLFGLGLAGLGFRYQRRLSA